MTKFFYIIKINMKVKYQVLIEKREDVRTRHFNDSKAFTKNTNDMDEIYKNIGENSSNKKHKILFCCAKTIKLISTFYVIMKIPNK